jgi:RND superfamily putative drug exporter
VTGPLYGVGRLCVRGRFVVLAIWLVVVVALAIVARGVGEQTSDDLVLPGTDSQRASDTLTKRFPDQANGTNPLTLAAPKGHEVTEAKYKQAIDGVVATHGKDKRVIRVVSPLDSAGAGQLSKGASLGYISLTLKDSPSELSKDEAQSVIAEADPLKAAGLQVAAGGYLGQKVSKPSSHTSEVVGIVAAILILLFTFGTVVAMGMPIVTALLGLVAGMSVITLLGQVVQVPTTAPALATMIGLGVGIDYGLFVVTRHREQLRGGMEVHESIARTTATAGGAVLFAGGTVIIALLSLALAGIPIVTTLGYTSAIVVAIAVAAALTLLPALLAVLGLRINALRLPGFKTHHDARPHGWQRWARFVANGPWPALAAGVVILLVLAIPLRKLHLGQTDVGALPTDTQARQAYDRMSAGFGPGASGPMLVAVQLSRPATTSDPRLQTLRTDMQETKGVASVGQPLVNQSGTAAVYTLVSANAPSSRATEDTVNDLRDNVIPKATQGQAMTADVGGTTAGYIDLATQISRKLPLVIGVVLLLSFCLLTLAFRSLLVPLKAVVMNLLSIAAAFGVVTYAFGHHWSATLVGLDGVVPIVSFVPLMMFAILFGLSMDYEVFLMTHVRERWRATGDAHQAVIEGLAGTARVITSAALIMVSVFCAFVINGDPNIKQFGLGMAAAVAVDATIVRCLLVPAIMSLLGPAAWWMPAWLERHLPQLSIEGEDYFAERDAAEAVEAPKVPA